MHPCTLSLCLAYLAMCTGAGTQAAELASTQDNQTQVAVTIYNSDLALVKDARAVRLNAGAVSLAWRDVSAQMRPETALLRDLSDPKGIALIEQSFDFDLLTPQALLQKYVGRKVRILTANPSTGAQTSEEATVLAANEGVVLRFADRIESSPNGRIAFEGVPDNLRDHPTLVIDLRTPRAAEQNLELSYLTGGLSWKADYVAELSEADDFLDLNGWVTIVNQSGAAYPHARLQLVAGDVNRVREPRAMGSADLVRLAAAPKALAPMQEEGLLDYHLYTLDRPTSLEQNQTKQVALLSAIRVPVAKEYLLRGADYYYRSVYSELGKAMKVAVLARFDNREPSLGLPLPKGVIRVYKKDRAGSAQFVGEDQIDHTPKNETIQLKLGDAFDVTASKRQTDFQKSAGSGRYPFVYEVAFELELKNAKSTPVSIHVQEPIPGDWTILSESAVHTKEAAGVAGWQIPVPSNGSVKLTYRVRVQA